jgi:hypothetical protein
MEHPAANVSGGLSCLSNDVTGASTPGTHLSKAQLLHQQLQHLCSIHLANATSRI